MEILAFINQKGGTGKTTTCQNVGAGLMREKKKVLYVDADPQCNLTFTVGATYDAPGTFEAITGTAPAADLVQHAQGGDILSATPLLSSVHEDSKGDPKRLAKALKGLKEYDYILIDTPPTMGQLVTQALLAATGCIICAHADILNVTALEGLSGTIEALQKKNKALEVWGVVLTRYNDRAIVSRDAAEALAETTREQLGAKIYKTRCRAYIAVSEAQAMQQDIFTYAPKSKAAADAKALTKEILKGRAK